MITITHKINDPRGVHARPAGQLVKVLSAFSCKVEIGPEGKLVDGKKLLAVMKLAMQQGDTMTLNFDGADEQEAAKSAEEFLKNNL